MASYGLRIRNDDGYTMIDGQHTNLTKRASGTVSTSTDLKPGFRVAYITLTSITHPVVVVACPTGAWAEVYYVSGTTASVAIISYGDVTRSVKYWAFGDPGPATPAWGLVIRKPGGNDIAYNSTMSPLRVVAQVSGTAGGSNGGTVLSLPAGRTYAVMQYGPMAHSRAQLISGGVPANWMQLILRGCFGVDGREIKLFGKGEWASQGWGQIQPPSYDVGGEAFVVDVTGY